MTPYQHRDEKAFNQILGPILGAHAMDAEIVVETSGQLFGSGQPDFTVTRPDSEKVLIENKYANTPETSLVKQCEERIGRIWTNNTPVRAVIGLKTPARFADHTTLESDIRSADDFSWAAWTASADRRKGGWVVGAVQRLPQDGWITGSIAEFVGFIYRISAEAADIQRLTDKVQKALNAAAVQIGESSYVSERFAAILKQASGEQTNRMAAAVMLNAAVFQSRIAKHHSASGVLTPAQMLATEVRQYEVAQQWTKILKIDYHPIFRVSYNLLCEIPDPVLANNLLNTLFAAANKVAAAPGSQGLVGRLFGALIADKKFLATFYTLPSSAALLAETAVEALDIADWGDPSAVTRLRVADFACGTGALLTAVYARIAERHRLAGGDAADIHQGLLERTMIGCDTMPAAVHLTAARLSGECPEKDYQHARTYVMPYGDSELPGGTTEIRLGSLDLLNTDTASALWGDGTIVTSATHDERTTAVIADESLDLVIMNPPFTRPTNHESHHAGVRIPAFAGMGTTDDEQKAMSKALKSILRRNPSTFRVGNGYAGLASNFMDLAHAKLKPGGVLALVMPAVIVSGPAWRSARKLLAEHYSNLAITSIASDSSTSTARAFSADTGLAEVLVTARKCSHAVGNSRVRHSVLKNRPSSVAWGVEVARALAHPQDGRLKVGEDNVGWTVQYDFGIDEGGHPTGIAQRDVARTAASLTDGSLVLPRLRDRTIPICGLGSLGHTGPVHRDINGTNLNTKEAIGPFDIADLKDRGIYRTRSWPVLWSHDASKETKLTVLPCSEGIIRSDIMNADGTVRVEMHRRALKLWEGGYRTGGRADGRVVAGATRLHINSDFRVTSQPLGACLTPARAIGGTAWPSFHPTPGNPENVEHWEKTLCVWLNTTLGLIGRWWVSSRQQQGRARLSVTTVGLIPVLDLRSLTAAQVQDMSNLFDDFESAELLPANQAAQDPVRRQLDTAVMKVLGSPIDSTAILESLATVREQWCTEPSNQ